LEHFKIHELDEDWTESAPVSTACLSAPLDGRIVFLKQRQGFWIAAEDNAPEQVTVHVAAKRRWGSVDLMEEITYENLNGVYAV
jgi:hypothetical protein